MTKPSARLAAAKVKGHIPTVPALVAEGRGPQFDPDALSAAQEAIAAVTGADLTEPTADDGGVDVAPPAGPAPDAAAHGATDTDSEQPPASPSATDQKKED